MPHSAPLSRTTARTAPTRPRRQQRHEKVMEIKDMQNNSKFQREGQRVDSPRAFPPLSVISACNYLGGPPSEDYTLEAVGGTIRAQLSRISSHQETLRGDVVHIDAPGHFGGMG